MIIITAPSGAGKTTIAKFLLQHIPQLAFSVSATTRPKRGNEREGVDYYFISKEEFLHKIEHNEFAEWEEVYHNIFYGTLKSEIEKLWKEGNAVLFDVDVKGALNLKNQFGISALSLFIKIPSEDTLFERLRKRSTETHEKIAERISRATIELQYENKFDVVILNDELSKAQQQALQMVSDFLENENAYLVQATVHVSFPRSNLFKSPFPTLPVASMSCWFITSS